MAFNGTPPNSTNRNAAASSGAQLGQIEYFASERSLEATGKHLALAGGNFLWTSYAEFNENTGGIAPAFAVSFVSENISESTNNQQSSFGAFKDVGTNSIWTVPSSTSNKITVSTDSDTFSGGTWADVTVGAGGAVSYCVSHPTAEGTMCGYSAAVSTLAYSVATALLTGWADIDLNSVASLSTGLKSRGGTCSGASGRFYYMGVKTDTIEIAYSAVDDVSTGWTAWAGALGGNSGTIDYCSIAVKEGTSWVYSAGAGDIPGRIYRATSLGGASSLVLDVSASNQDKALVFYLTYDSAQDVFIAVPSIAGFHTYASSDDGATWVKGDKCRAAAQHHVVRHNTTDDVYIVPLRSASVVMYFLQLDSTGAPRLSSTRQLNKLNNSFFTTSGTAFLAITNPDTSFGLCQNSSTAAYEVTVETDFSTEFSVPFIYNDVGDSTASVNVPMGYYPAIKVKS